MVSGAVLHKNLGGGGRDHLSRVVPQPVGPLYGLLPSLRVLVHRLLDVVVEGVSHRLLDLFGAHE